MSIQKQSEQAINDLDDMAFDESYNNIIKHHQAIDRSIVYTVQRMLLTLAIGAVLSLVAFELFSHLVAIIIIALTLFGFGAFFKTGAQLSERLYCLKFCSKEHYSDAILQCLKKAENEHPLYNDEDSHQQRWAKSYIYNIVKHGRKELTQLELYYLDSILTH